MIEKVFVKDAIKQAQIEEYLRKRFEKAGYSRSEIQRTPLGTRIIVYAYRPTLVIGRGGRRLGEIAKELSEKFGLQNPMIDVREVENPFLDANIVAKRIAKAIERGINYKKVCNYYVRKVMEAGAIGVKIRVSGKLAGKERSRFAKFQDGFIVQSGHYSETLVDRAQAQALIKPGIVGVEVMIMKEMPKELELEKVVKHEGVEAKGVEKA